jgi:hypothetical protein
MVIGLEGGASFLRAVKGVKPKAPGMAVIII